MTKSCLGLFAAMLLSGCVESAPETKVDDSPPVANVPESMQTRSAQTRTADPPAGAEAGSPVDAARLLVSTLEQAKAENKRVMLHIGAPG